MIKKIYYKIKWLPSELYNLIMFKIRGICREEGLKTRGRIFIRGKGKITIGNNVTINSCVEANPIGGGFQTLFYIKDTGELRIGNNVGISNSAFYSENSILIEDNVFIGNNCKIYDSNFHSLNYYERVTKQEDIKTAPVCIQEGAFIGAHVIILKGVTVGRHSIVGAGSVVTKSIPNNEVWAGNPAQFIRKIK